MEIASSGLGIDPEEIQEDTIGANAKVGRHDIYKDVEDTVKRIAELNAAFDVDRHVID